MNKTLCLSVKTWALLCFYASIALLLYVPIYGSVYNDYVLIILSVITCIRKIDDVALKTLCFSVIMSSALGVVSYYYNQYYIFSIQENIGGEMYYAIWFFVSLLPLIYSLIKKHDLLGKIGVAVIVVALIPSLFYVFTVDISLIVFSTVLVGFFLVSAFDTNDSTTRNISILAGLGALIMMLNNIENVVWYFCDKPQLDGWYSWIDYDKDKFPVFSFCMKYNRMFTWSFFVGCALMLTYFAHLFKRSNFTLKAICLPAIIAFVLIWGVHSSVGFLNHNFDVIVYILFAFSFYKLNNKL